MKMILSCKLHSRLLRKRKRIKSKVQNELFLLGKTKKGVYTDYVELKKTTAYGCGMIPGIPTDTMGKAAVVLIKKRLHPAGIAIIGPNDPDIGWDGGDDIWNLPGVPFLYIGPHEVYAKCIEKIDSNDPDPESVDIIIRDTTRKAKKGKTKK